MPDGNVKLANVALADVSQFQLRRDDVLVVRGNGNRLLCGKAGIVAQLPEGCFYPDLLIRLRFDPSVMLQEFAVMQWNEPKTHARLISKAKSTNGIWKINGKDIQSHSLAVPPIPAQHRFLAEANSMHRALRRLSDYHAKGLALRNQLLNAIFGAGLHLSRIGHSSAATVQTCPRCEADSVLKTESAYTEAKGQLCKP